MHRSINKKRRKRTQDFYTKIVKRFLDVGISILIILGLSWLMLIIALLVRINLGSPVIFTQERPGKDGKIFKLYKFRSMSNEKDANGDLLPDSERLNVFGKILRSTSMDELPEVFNILKGDMSIIGPRPLLVKYLNYYNPCEMRRHIVRPGMTGLAQISGRNQLSWKERFEKDLEYVDNVSFTMDMKIFFRTLKKIFMRDGIEFVGVENIMDYFSSNDRCSD